MTIVEDYSPMYCGDTSRPLAPVFQTIDPKTGEVVPFPLTDLTVSMRMRPLGVPSLARDCTGDWIIDLPLLGQAHYEWTDEDVALPGIYEVQVELTDEDGKPVHTDIIVLEIAPTL
jgi:hypothetical protein